MLVGNLDTLRLVHLLDFLQDVVLHLADTRHAQQLLGIQRSFGDGRTGFDFLADLDPRPQGLVRIQLVRNRLVFVGDGDFLTHGAFDTVNGRDLAGDLCNDRNTLRVTGFEQFLDTGKTLCDVTGTGTGHTTGVECTHGQLGTRFTDGLRSHDADRFTHFDVLARGHVPAIALPADALGGFACEGRADVQTLDACIDDLLRNGIVDELVALDDDLPGFGIQHILLGVTSGQTVLQAFDDGVGLAVHQVFHPVTGICAAVVFLDDDILCHIHQTTGQVSGFRCLQSGIGQTLPHTVGGQEEFTYVQTFTEAGVDGHLDDRGHKLARPGFTVTGTCHQTTHAGQLGEVLLVASGTGLTHHENRVFPGHVVHQFICDLVLDVIPHLVQAGFPFGQRQQTLLLHLLQGFGLRTAFIHVLLLVRGNLDVGQRHGDAGCSRVLESHGLDLVQDFGGFIHGIALEHLRNDGTQVLLLEGRHDFAALDEFLHVLTRLDEVLVGSGHKVFLGHLVNVREIRREHTVEDDLAHGRGQIVVLVFLAKGGVLQAFDRHGDPGVQVHLAGLVGHHDFLFVGEHGAFVVRIALPVCSFQRQVLLRVAACFRRQLVGSLFHRQVKVAHDHVLARGNDRLAVLGAQDVVAAQHHDQGFRTGFFSQRHVNGHLVTVKVGVEGRTYQRVQTHGASFHQFRQERLDTQTVQRRRTVHQDRVAFDDLFHHIPDPGIPALDELLGVLRVGRQVLVHDLVDHERLEQVDCHFTGNAALVHLQIRSHGDNRTAGEIDPLAQQVLPEPALFSLQGVGQGLQCPAAGTGDRLGPASVVNQRIHGFLQHALFVLHDDVRRAQFEEFLQTVVPGDDTPVQVVQVTRREPPAVQLQHRPQIRRDDGDIRQDHPFRLVIRVAEGIDGIQALDELLALFALGLLQLFLDVFVFGLQVHVLQQALDGFRTSLRREARGAVNGEVFPVFPLRQHLLVGQAGVLGIRDDVADEVYDFLQLFRCHIQQQRHPGRNAAQIPDVGNGSRQMNVAHAFTPHAALGDLHTAAVADHTLETDFLVFAAGTFPVLGGTEDALAEQTVFFRFLRTVVDGFRLGHFPVRPPLDGLRAGKLNLDGAEFVDTHSASVSSFSVTAGRSSSSAMAGNSSSGFSSGRISPGFSSSGS